MNDTALIRATLCGEINAFGRLARRYQRALVASARHLTGNAEDAEDLAQEALVKAYQHLRTLQEPEKFRAWLFTILRHLCLNHLQRQPDVPASLDEIDERLAALQTPEGTDITSLLDRLPLIYREVLVAHYMMGLRYEEIAVVQGLNLHTVRMRAIRARALLKQLRREEEEEESRLLTMAMTAVPLSSSAAFMDRILQEVKTMHPLAPSSPAGMSSSLSGFSVSAMRAMGWKIAGVLLLALLVPGLYLANRPKVIGKANTISALVASAPPAVPHSITGEANSKSALIAHTPLIVQHLRVWDNQLRTGSIHYDVFPTALPNNLAVYPEHDILYFDAKGRYNQIRAGSPAIAMQNVFDGTDNLLISRVRPHAPSIASPTNNKPDDPGLRPMQVNFTNLAPITNSVNRKEIIPGPCFTLGRGLSMLQNIAITTDKTGTHLSGTFNSDKITAVLDPAHEYIAREIKLFFTWKGREYCGCRWSLGSPHKFGNAPCIATDSTIQGYALPDPAKPLIETLHSRYVISKASYNKPEDSLLAYDWHAPNLLVIDERVGGQFIIHAVNSLPATMTSKELLQKTHEMIAQRQKYQAGFRRH